MDLGLINTDGAFYAWMDIKFKVDSVYETYTLMENFSFREFYNFISYKAYRSCKTRLELGPCSRNALCATTDLIINGMENLKSMTAHIYFHLRHATENVKHSMLFKYTKLYEFIHVTPVDLSKWIHNRLNMFKFLNLARKHNILTNLYNHHFEPEPRTRLYQHVTSNVIDKNCPIGLILTFLEELLKIAFQNPILKTDAKYFREYASLKSLLDYS
ncbi:MAG: hypothetical protein AABY22_27245 [Nanoarchaeota archaeon]